MQKPITMFALFAGMVLLLTYGVSNAQRGSTRDLNGAASDLTAAHLAEQRLDFFGAISWYEKAAMLGNAESMNELGWIYFGSHDIPGRHFQDYAKAAIWFQRAADLNYAPAITQLGVMYGSDGSEGVPENDARAAQLYLRAAKMGEPYAMNHLGYVYYHGKGLPADIDKAVFWWRKAVAAGGAPAKAAQTWLDLLHR